METTTQKISRIEAIDALRGFAVFAILLVHHLEHFIFSVYPTDSPAWLNVLDNGTLNAVFSLFAGKAYAIFSLLFGFTFYIQYENQSRLGKDFGYRFIWRLVGLTLFATLNAAFFPAGDVLLLYAIMGLILFVVRKWSDRAILLAAFFFTLQPMEWFHYIASLVSSSYQLPDYGVDAMYAEVGEITKAGNFWDFIWCNITLGQKASLMWAVGAGRLLQTGGLFLIGLYLGRTQRFVTSVKNLRFWTKTLIVSAISFAPLFSLRNLIMEGSAVVQQTAGTAFDMWQKLAFTFVLVSSFMLLYQQEGFRNKVANLRFYGKMSLTNYISQSIIGAFIYFPFGLYLAPYCGYTLSLLIGLLVFLVQVKFCKWWFKNHKQGPLENLWHKWTWIKGSSLKCSTILIALFISLNVSAQSQYKRGYPQRGDNFDVLPGFRQPPKGYGNVPFYWWSGDKLTRERLEAQLDILSESATDGFAISYIHTHPQIDSLFNKNGYGLFGRTEPGSPAVFSDDWWDIWTWFSGECAKRDVAAGLDDYTVGWIGNGYYPDEIEERPEFQNYRGKLKIETLTIKKGQKVSTNLPEDFLTAVFWPGAVTLDHLVNNGSINWEATENGNLYIISTEDSYILHPQYGKALVEVYFDRFEQKMTPQQREGMNYFFQDEMSYPIDMLTWTSDFPQEFQKRKGYDITPYLPALKEYIGPQTPKIRLDYAEVLTDLAEERYYRPIYDWHAKRGLIYGSDNLGRGKDPLAYVDYFHANSWYTAPGNDAPSKGSSFIQTKVSSSIAHLYNRPRTWLEAFHSMGWGSSGEWLTQQIDHHFMAGGNLVCMHGLYYSTHGGWWEWAPPCFHFRMPYWPHMKEWLKYTERMSYLLSQGDHVCDIALIYPTEPLQAYPEASPRGVFATAQQLSNAGLDYDFLDFRSLRNAGIKDKALHITNEKYRIIILSDMRAIHHSSLEKIRDFYRAGGIVLASGVLPEASSHEGEQDKEVDTILQEIFGLTAREAKEGKTVSRQTNQAGGTGIYVADGAVEKVVPQLILPDFIPNEKGGKVLHRRIGKRDMYMVMNVEKGSECFFRSTGKVELWDATDGSIMDLPILRQTEQGTWIRMDKEYTNSYLIVFSPGKPKMLENTKLEIAKPIHTIPVEGEWKVKLVPTLNNQWGDYRLPASNEMIGAEARVFDFKAQEWSEWKKDGIFGYGPQAISNYGQSQSEEYTFSWEYGVWNNPGSQGYHGLKSKVSDGFFILDKGGKHSFSTYVYAPKTDVYRIEQIQITADRILINGKLATEEVKLKKGWHSLVAEYENTTANKLSMWVGEMKDSRDRGAVVLLRKDAPAPVKPSIYDDRVSMLWTSSDHLMYDPYKGAHPVWEYRFTSVPGMEQMKFSVYGELQNVMVDNQKLKIEPIGEIRKNGINQYVTTLSKRAMRCEQVTFSVKVQPGYQGPIAIAEPIKISTGEGLLDVGDWSKTGALKFYSGGMTYKKNFNIPDNFQSNRIMLDLGKVSATCEIKVNGQAVGVRMSPPYNADITPYLKAGENEIEVLVYSTLANHYQTQPTPYRGEPTAGILGPVKIEIYNTNE